MEEFIPVPLNTGIFTLGGNHFIIRDFLGDRFTTYLAYKHRRMWRYSPKPVTELSAELVAQLIAVRRFEVVRWTPPAPHTSAGKP